MIKLENISKAYKDITLFNEVNAEFESGSRIAIKGVNGSGKSVLLKMVCGYAKPDSGRILIDGQELGKGQDFIRNAGISINSPEFIDSMSGMDNLLYLINIQKKATKADVLALAERLRLDGLNKKYKTYSLGMRQKMRLIQALVEKPDYMILDEPFDALDDTSRETAKQVLEEYSENKTLIFTSHNQEDIDALATVIYQIDDHQLIRQEIKR